MISKVLIVDDEPINVKLIEEILEYEDKFLCRAAASGEEALSILSEYHPDIILLDIMMPGISGYEVCRRIKKDKRHKFAKVLMISGKAMVEERLQGYEAGADDYITKPFIDDELLAKLKVFSKLKKTEEIDELKTSILQLFSHETKTPLNGILLGSQLIIDSPSLPEKIIDYATLIKISGERIHNLVRKILLLSNLRNNKKLHLRSQSVQEYLFELVETTRSNSKKKCTLLVECPTDFNMNVDWNLFHEAFYSVVENAIKYSPENEPVLLEAFCKDSTPFFRVTDHGNGLDPFTKDKIFDEFYSQHIENHSKGTALSLAIAREIMTLHLGTLTVESELGQGASFLFTLPPHALSI